MRAKSLFVFIFTTTLFALLTYSLSVYVILPPFKNLEQRELSKSLDRCQGALQADAAALLRMVTEYAEWDDTYAFMQDNNQEYIRDNLVWSYFKEDLEIDALFIINKNGHTIWGELYPETAKKAPEEKKQSGAS